MFAWKKIINKHCAGSAPPSEKIAYSLEAIMALQKSLEHGLDDYSPSSKIVEDADMAEQESQSVLTPLFIGTKRFLRWLFLPRISGISKKQKKRIKKPGRTAQPSS